mgnify:CR=1 FL=1
MRVHFIQHVLFENPGSLLDWAGDQKHEITFTRIFEIPAFPSVDEIDMLVVMGGPMSVYEEEKYSWLKDEKSFIRSIIESGKKVLGICLGSQLVAEALGAKVYPNKEKEIGWWRVRKLAVETLPKLKTGNEFRVTNGIPEEFTSFHWHGDTFDIPDGATHLFSTRACNNQGFLYGTQIAALQFHPEITEELLDAMVENGRNELVAKSFVQSEQVIKSKASVYLPVQRQYMKTFIKNFQDL